jgi:hypothetical protein
MTTGPVNKAEAVMARIFAAILVLLAGLGVSTAFTEYAPD